MEEKKKVDLKKPAQKANKKGDNENKPSYIWIYLVMAVLTGILLMNNVFTDSATALPLYQISSGLFVLR